MLQQEHESGINVCAPDLRQPNIVEAQIDVQGIDGSNFIGSQGEVEDLKVLLNAGWGDALQRRHQVEARHAWAACTHLGHS